MFTEEISECWIILTHSACGNRYSNDFQSEVTQMCRQIRLFPIEYRFDSGTCAPSCPSHVVCSEAGPFFPAGSDLLFRLLPGASIIAFPYARMSKQSLGAKANGWF